MILKLFEKKIEYIDWDDFIEQDRYYRALGGS